MKVTALAGGVGAARFLSGLVEVVPAESVTAIVNTGDDFIWMGLRICPDLDTVIYTLAGLANQPTGWGIEGDCFECLTRLSRLGGPDWFQVGDRDLATHLARTNWLSREEPLSAVTRRLCERDGVRSLILPMSDEPVPTIVHTTEGDLSFQEYFVRERCEPTVTRLTHDGAAAAIPAPGTLESIAAADLIIVCPSNPLISIGPILAVGGIRRALCASAAPVVGISPIIAGQALKGPTISLMSQLGHEPSAAGVAALYSDFMDAFVLDDADGALVARVRSSGVHAHLAPTLMDTPESRRRLAARVLEVPFLFIGLLGLARVQGLSDATLGLHYRVFCIGVALVALGSAYYHFEPSTPTLVWDRLPMTVAFMALFAAVLMDRVSTPLGRALLWPLVALGIASIAWWVRTELAGQGDLRPYALVQFLPMLLMPVILLLSKGGGLNTAFLWMSLGAYGAAKLAEHFDLSILEATGVLSGHSLKHLLAALGAWWAIRAFQKSPARAL